MSWESFAERHLDVVSRADNEWACLCPFHKDSNPSFSFNVKRGLFVCYACDARGTASKLADHLGVVASDTPRSIDELKSKIEMLGQPVASATISKSLIDVWRTSPRRSEVWATRGITDDDMLDDFDLGVDELHNAMTIPVHHPSSKRPVSVIRRLLQPEPGSPKYRYERGFKISENLYGSWHARQRNTSAVAVTEGSIDTLALWHVGIPAVALLGSRVSKTQAALLRSLDVRTIVVMTDNDTAGRRAAEELAAVMPGSGVRCLRPTWWPSKAKDPAEMSESDRLESFGSALSVRRSTR